MDLKNRDYIESSKSVVSNNAKSHFAQGSNFDCSQEEFFRSLVDFSIDGPALHNPSLVKAPLQT